MNFSMTGGAQQNKVREGGKPLACLERQLVVSFQYSHRFLSFVLLRGQQDHSCRPSISVAAGLLIF